ncbi:MAG: ATP synthase F1 subunit gamma [Ignavibacteriaceae bacterium]|nr:ATP synthase F1 subunit gamma [Ignavibacteriaceae bacterium]
MATLRDIRRRIKGVQNTEQITKAMKMVAAAKLRRAQENVISARPYARKISGLVNHLLTDELSDTNPLLVEKPIKKVLVVVLTSDRGLCGAFNTNILKEAVRFIGEELIPQQIEYSMYCIGKKGFDFFRKRDYTIAGNTLGVFGHLKFTDALAISNEIISGYLNGDYDKIVIVYNEFKSVVRQEIVREQYLPISFGESEKVKRTTIDYIFEPSQKEIIDSLLPKHLQSQMWRMLLESNASEYGARMTAMDNASTNAKELIRSLKITYNKARQAAITKEILEVVSGANASRSA